MKRLPIIFSITFFFLTVITLDVTAQSPSSPAISKTVSITPSEPIDINVQRLKDKIATKVAELRKDSNTVVAGYIEKIEKSAVTVGVADGKKFTLAYDDTV